MPDTKRHIWKDAQFGAALAAAPVILTILWRLKPIHPDWLWPLHAPMHLFLLVLLYPVVEEIVFRGALQGALIHKPWGFRTIGPLSVANLLVSVMFAGIHFVHHPPFWATLIFFPSLVFGYFRDRYASLTPAILLHMFYNAGYYLLFKPV